MKAISLDHLYKMTAYIYSEQNAVRSVASTFSHFVEVCGMLTILDRKKKKEGLDFVDALCKALGWYFPLLSKLRIRSVEELVFRKYPYVCPYCRKAPHEDFICKTVRGTERTVNHESLREHYESNKARLPKSLDDWQAMFQRIYPRSTNEAGRSTLGLFEELGELAEAVRVFDRYPKYFAGEAADTFSYLMGIANEYSLRLAQETGTDFSLHDEFLKRFPGLCIGCGNRVCVCPSIPRSTVGRMSKELDIHVSEQLFEKSDDIMITEGRAAASEVLHSIGGYKKLVEGFPADRGDANTALMVLCMQLASAVEKSNPILSERFQSAAIELGTSLTEAGSKHGKEYLSTDSGLVSALREAWRTLRATPNASSNAINPASLAFDLGTSLGKVRLLFVYASPKDETGIRVSSELRAIKESLKLSTSGVDIEIDSLPSSTVDDLRRALLIKTYEILHFAGHADANSILFEDERGESVSVPTDALAELLKQHPSVRCVVLNACESLTAFNKPLADYTVGMTASIADDSAIEFARGFYDAIGCGRSIEFAVDAGKNAAMLKSMSEPPTKIIKR